MNVIVSSLIDTRWVELRKLFEPGTLTSILDVPEKDSVFRDEFHPSALLPILKIDKLDSLTVLFSSPESIIVDKLLGGMSIDDNFLDELRNSYLELFRIMDDSYNMANLILIDDVVDGTETLPNSFDKKFAYDKLYDIGQKHGVSKIVQSSISFLSYFDFFIRLYPERYRLNEGFSQNLNYFVKNSKGDIDKNIFDIERYIKFESYHLNNSLDKKSEINIKSLEDRVISLARTESKSKNKISWLREERNRLSINNKNLKVQSRKALLNLISTEVKLARVEYNAVRAKKISSLFKSKKEKSLNFQIYILKNSSYFDSQWYLINNPDVKASNISPERHFIIYGAQENRDPSKYFNVRYYLKNNPDVKMSNVNPLVHFLLNGCYEGRKILGEKLC